MFPYLIVFGACTAICTLGCSSEKRGGKAVFYAASFAVVLILALFAGLRSSSVGTDTAGYAMPLFNLASGSSSFSSFYHLNWLRAWGWSSVDTIEIGYLGLVWIAAKLGSSQVLLFLTALLTVGPIYIALAMRRKELSLPVALFVFMFLYFNDALNAMRQWIAIAFIFLAFAGVYSDKKPLRAQPAVFVLVIVAYLFHTSAVLGFIPLLLMWFIRGGNAKLRIGLVAIAFLLVLVSVNSMRIFLINQGLVRYANYFGDGNLGFSFGQFLLKTPFVFAAIGLFTSKKIDQNTAAFYVCMALLALLCGQFSTLTDQSGRIGHYFDIYMIPTVGLLAGFFCNGVESKRIIDRKITFEASLYPFSILYCIVYWYYTYVLMNSCETMPYLFFWN